MQNSSLKIGDVISAGIRIYRDNFQQYLQIAIIAGLWAIIPIYGWAKYMAACGLISRLAFSQVIEKPETVSSARSHIDSNMWQFLLAGILVSLIFFAFILGFLIAGFILLAIFYNLSFSGGEIVVILAGIAFFLVLIIGTYWLTARLTITELPIAVESNVGSTKGISRSWQLTQQFVGKLILIFFVASLITIPVSIAANIVSTIFQIIVVGILGGLLGEDNSLVQLISILLNLSISIVLGAAVMPFWQSIKAVIYYDLRSRKEGIDLVM